MSSSTFPAGKALGLAAVIWMVGFVWGSIVFVVPALKSLSSVPYVSQYPAISFPLLVLFALLAFYFGRACLRSAANRATAGMWIGLIFAGVNVLLDFLVIVILFRGGAGFYGWASIWLGYALLLFIPWLQGRLREA